jgi:hypothetical protein
MLLAMPLAVQEMVFAAWLLVKGLERREPRLRSTIEPHVPAPA